MTPEQEVSAHVTGGMLAVVPAAVNVPVEAVV